jgi:glyoxylase-like metal-dependent hydrolase (beta-lactamase superfamily II)
MDMNALRISAPWVDRRVAGSKRIIIRTACRRVLAVGDTLIDRGNGLELLADWLREDVTREQLLAVLRPLLELPVELVLPTHVAPTDRAALERALS